MGCLGRQQVSSADCRLGSPAAGMGMLIKQASFRSKLWDACLKGSARAAAASMAHRPLGCTCPACLQHCWQLCKGQTECSDLPRQGSVLIEYLWHEEMGWHLSHRWPQSILQDMSLPVHLLGVTCTDPIYAEWDRLVSWRAATLHAILLILADRGLGALSAVVAVQRCMHACGRSPAQQCDVWA